MNKIAVFDLFQGQHRYLAPLFQRGYVWTRGTHWEHLWQDLVDLAEQPDDQNAGPRWPSRRHLMGAIVLHRVPTRIDDSTFSMALRRTPLRAAAGRARALMILEALGEGEDAADDGTELLVQRAARVRPRRMRL